MQRSPELEAWERELFATSDRERIVDAHSMNEDVVVIGTDEKEWIEGGEAVAAMWRSTEMPSVAVDDVRCYEEGSVAWLAGRVRFQLPDGTEVAARITGVAHREDGNWKIVQSHTSTGD